MRWISGKGRPMKSRWSRGALLAAAVAGAVTVPAILASLAVAGLLPSESVTDPPGWEASLGKRALAASLSRRAAGIDNPIAAHDEAALLSGMKIFRNNCAGCHGDVDGPSAWGSKGFYPRVPQFWQEPVSLTPAEAFVAVRDGVRYSGMSSWRENMEPEEMWQVANFVSRMHSLPQPVDKVWRAEVQKPAK